MEVLERLEQLDPCRANAGGEEGSVIEATPEDYVKLMDEKDHLEEKAIRELEKLREKIEEKDAEIKARDDEIKARDAKIEELTVEINQFKNLRG